MLKTTMKCMLLTAALTGSVATVSFAEESKDDSLIPGTFTGSVAFTTDYRFRGITQTQGDPAVQGGLTWTHPSGFYVGIWGSNLKFVDGDKADLEIDSSFGITNTLKAWTYDVGAIRYNYPGSKPANVGLGKYDYWEVYGNLAYDFRRRVSQRQHLLLAGVLRPSRRRDLLSRRRCRSAAFPAL